MEHKPWIGPNYDAGFNGSKLLVMGFSHWGRYSDTEIDNPEFTRSVMTRWAIPGEIRFFNTVARYFRADQPSDFWNNVAFANTLPTTVGDEDERYSAGTSEQRAIAPDRTMRLVAELKPDHIFVFSKKGWVLWPDFTGTLRNGTLRVQGVGEYDAGTYAHGDGEAIAFGFPHPQFTPVDPAIRAVAAAMAATVDSLRPATTVSDAPVAQ